MTDDLTDPPHARHSAEIWEHARRDYLDGCSARVVAERHGFSERTVRRRAAEEGWRRLDHPARRPWVAPDWPDRRPASVRFGAEAELERQPELAPFVAGDSQDIAELLFEPTGRNLGHYAFRRAAECAALGGAAEALSWMRLAEATARASARFESPVDLPFKPADYMRAAFAERLRDLDGVPNASDSDRD